MRPAFPALRTFLPADAQIIQHLYSPAPKRNAIAFGVILPFALQPVDGAEAPAFDSLWDHVAKVLGKHGTLDEGWPKARGELLAAGACHPPRGHGAQPVAVSISAGGMDKQLAVFGERRYGLAGRVSAPQPFDHMPLTPAQAFGGEGHAANPLGKGVDTREGAELPNVEWPHRLISARSDQPDPAGFGPLPIAAPQRARHLGEHGSQWLKERWPHLPLDTDPRFFQTAPEDQQIDGYWMGGESITVRNMHPEFPDLFGQVPTLRPRFFVHQTQADGEARFRELNVNADTLWLLPGERMGLVIYRALVPIDSSDARDINAFLAEFEGSDAIALPIDYYIARCLRAMSPDTFKDIPDPAELQKAHAALSNDEMVQKVREQKALFQKMLEDHNIDESTMLEQLAVNPHTRKFAQAIVEHGSFGGFLSEIEHVLRIIDGEDPTAPAPHSPTLDSVLPKPAATASEAPLTAPEPPSGPYADALRDNALAARHRQTVLYRVGNGQSCSGLDLTQANLAGLDLAGMDFSGALLTGANLAGAQLQGANLQDANLQGARLDAANLSGCHLMQATLDRASFSGAVLKGAILDGSDCTRANFSGTDLSGVSLRQASLSYAWLNQIKAPQIQADGADFSHAGLDGIDLSHAVLDHANFTGARLRRAVLDSASCISANFTQADLSDASLVRCDLSSSQSTPGSQWQGANLQNAILNDASWMGASLDGVQMQACKARNTDLSDTDLRNSRILEADMRGAIFDRAQLGNAVLSRSNLMETSFANANLNHCRLDATNLYGATFMDTLLEHANFEGANLDGTILKIRAQS